MVDNVYVIYLRHFSIHQVSNKLLKGRQLRRLVGKIVGTLIIPSPCQWPGVTGSTSLLDPRSAVINTRYGGGSQFGASLPQKASFSLRGLASCGFATSGY